MFVKSLLLALVFSASANESTHPAVVSAEQKEPSTNQELSIEDAGSDSQTVNSEQSSGESEVAKTLDSSESTKPAESEVSETENSNPTSDVVVTPQDSGTTTPDMSCSDMFVEYLKRQPKAVQDKNLDTYYTALDSYGFSSLKNDEFAWKEKEAEYKENYKRTLATKSSSYRLYSKVKLGKYDFKKKGFPIEVSIEKDGLLGTFYSGGYMSAIISSTVYGGNYSCFGRVDSGIYPRFLNINVNNLKKSLFISVPEAEAKEITASLGQERLVEMNLYVEPINVKAKPALFSKTEIGYTVITKAQKATLRLIDKNFEISL